MTAPQLAERARNALEAVTYIVGDPSRRSSRASARAALRAAANEALSAQHWLGRLSARLDNELVDLELAELADAYESPAQCDHLADVYAALNMQPSSLAEDTYARTFNQNGH